MKAIVTKFHGPTNNRGSRYSARAEGLPALTLSADYGLDADANHRRLAVEFAKKYGWKGILHGGAMPDGTGYAWVFGTREGVKV